VVDVGKESESLRLRYPDRSRYIITSALLGIHVEPLSLEPDKKRHSRIQGYVRQLLIDHIHVPLSKKVSLESVLKDEANNAGRDGRPHYEVTLEYGKRYELWVVDIKLTNG
jgi:hypothetical protein